MVRLIGELLRPHRRTVAVLVTAMLVQAVMSLAAPWPLKFVLDNVVGNHPVPHWIDLPRSGIDGRMTMAALAAGATVLIAVISGLAHYVVNYFVESIGQAVGNDLRIRTYRHLLHLSLGYFDHAQTGVLLSTMTSDVSTIQTFASLDTVSIIVDSLTLLGMLGVMFWLHWDFALIAAALLPFLVVTVARIRAAIQTSTQEVRRRQADMVATMHEGVSSVRVVQAFAREGLEEEKLARDSGRAADAALSARRVRALLSPVVTVPIAVCTGVVLWRGSALILAGAMTIGSLTVFIAYLARFFGPVQNLSIQTDTIAQTSVAVQRVLAILNTRPTVPERSDATEPHPFRGEIAFTGVAFGYEAESAVLRDVNFTVAPGERIGIVGATGSGKSTVVSLIPRFYDIDSGSITIDGTDVRDFTLHGLRSQIGFVLQDTVLFRGSVSDNIAFGRPGATHDEIVRAATQANAHEFVTRMPLGYQTVIGERGLTLSGGERQRIGIARALIRDNPILILDEPTAALDAESEDAVVEALQRLMADRTVITIAHRLSTIRDADKIIVLDGGVVTETGTHSQLLAMGRVYAELYRKQFRGDARRHTRRARARHDTAERR